VPAPDKGGTGRIPVGLDSWAKCWRCGGYLTQTGEDALQRYAQCEICGEQTTLYHRRRAASR
jgi:hypothetical protein